MTDQDEIKLPPLPPLKKHAWLADSQTVRDYARAAVIADRKRRAEQAKPAKPKVHSRWIELFPDEDWTTSPGDANYQNTSTMFKICWTEGVRAWIDNKRNRKLAMQLRDWSIDDSFATLNEAADALDGGTQ